jgi:hypothetical protein
MILRDPHHSSENYLRKQNQTKQSQQNNNKLIISSMAMIPYDTHFFKIPYNTSGRTNGLCFFAKVHGLHGSWEDLRLVSVISVPVCGRMENGAVEGIGVHVLGLKPWGFQGFHPAKMRISDGDFIWI